MVLDVLCINEIRIQDSHGVVQLDASSTSSRSFLHTSGDRGAAGKLSVESALTGKAKATPL